MDDKNVPDYIWYSHAVSAGDLLKAYKRALKQCGDGKRQRGIPRGRGKNEGGPPPDSWLLKRLFACRFLVASMTAHERHAYMALQKQIKRHGLRQHIVVPKNVSEKDARRALKLLKLQCDPGWDFHVTWEGQPARKKLMTEKPPHIG